MADFVSAISGFLREILYWFIPWTVVPPDNKAYRVTLGDPEGAKAVGPGFCWQWPFGIQVVHLYQYYWSVCKTTVQSLMTKNGTSVQIAIIFKYRILDGHMYLFEIESDESYLGDIAAGAVAVAVESRDWPLDSREICADVLKELRKETAFSIRSVRLVDMIPAKALRLFQS